jgi:hypothetical protein
MDKILGEKWIGSEFNPWNTSLMLATEDENKLKHV